MELDTRSLPSISIAGSPNTSTRWSCYLICRNHNNRAITSLHGTANSPTCPRAKLVPPEPPRALTANPSRPPHKHTGQRDPAFPPPCRKKTNAAGRRGRTTERNPRRIQPPSANAGERGHISPPRKERLALCERAARSNTPPKAASMRGRVEKRSRTRLWKELQRARQPKELLKILEVCGLLLVRYAKAYLEN